MNRYQKAYAHGSKGERGPFEVHIPPTGICCLCGTDQGPFRCEIRPTGGPLQPNQSWGYCL